VSPLHVEITESYAKGWVAFFTSVCAVIGGVVSVMGLLDQYLFTRKNNSGMGGGGGGGTSSSPLLR
jgi:Endoplasmic reticulum vesicle transporter